jgi:small subunit ribosomal protein S8
LNYKGSESAIHEIKRISTPGLRIYEGLGTLSPVIGGLGIAIVTTHKGVMTNRQARKEGVGGEVLCTVW